MVTEIYNGNDDNGSDDDEEDDEDGDDEKEGDEDDEDDEDKGGDDEDRENEDEKDDEEDEDEDKSGKSLAIKRCLFSLPPFSVYWSLVSAQIPPRTAHFCSFQSWPRTALFVRHTARYRDGDLIL